MSETNNNDSNQTTSQNNKNNIIATIAVLIVVAILAIFGISYNSNIDDNTISIANTTNSTGNISENYENIGINSELLNIIFFDVGQADSTLITINGKVMLIDDGNTEDGALIADFLKAQNITQIDYLILTHLDEDHIGGTSRNHSRIKYFYYLYAK